MIAVTDDKCVRVFEISAQGRVQELSQRFMPKRPCAIEVLPNNATILCGDKFGDIYSLPLLPEDKEDVPSLEHTADEVDKSTKSFKPSATNLTVHTQRNRKALEAQLKQKNLTAKTKEPLNFEHELLLGHVSMLTDLVYATQKAEDKRRGYIITADRDEHIRVSRAPPQSHVIEGYCLDHKEFVSKLCLVPDTDLLLSGGGDDWISVWKWPEFRLRTRLDGLRDALRKESTQALPANGTEPESVAVSGIWVLPGEGLPRSNVVGVAFE